MSSLTLPNAIVRIGAKRAACPTVFVSWPRAIRKPSSRSWSLC